MKEFEEASLNDLLHEEISEHIVLETMNNSQNLPPEILRKIVPPLHLTKEYLKLIVLRFKENRFLDEELADLLCFGNDQLILALQQNSITQENREKLEKTLHTTQEKIKSLLLTNQLYPELAKIFLYILLVDKFHLKTIKTVAN